MRYFWLFFLVLIVNSTQAQDVLPRPDRYTAVTDQANMLNASEEAQLTRKLTNYQDSTSTQVAIVTISSLGGSTVEAYAQKLAESWGIGQQGADNGLLILIAKSDREIRIHTGYGLEATLTDQFCSKLISNVLQPNFKAEDYYKGLDKCTSLIINQLSGQFSLDDKALLAGSSLTSKSTQTAIFWTQWISTAFFLCWLLFINFLYHRKKKHRIRFYVLSVLTLSVLGLTHYLLGQRVAQKEIYSSIYTLFYDLLLLKSMVATTLLYTTLITYYTTKKGNWILKILLLFLATPVVGLLPIVIIASLLMIFTLGNPALEYLFFVFFYAAPVIGIPFGLWFLRIVGSGGGGGSNGYSYSSSSSSSSSFGSSGGSSFGGGSFGGGGASGGW